MASSPNPDSIGARIAGIRKLRGLTQTACAERADISYSLLMKIERGARPASDTVLASLARVLSVPVADLTGQTALNELHHDQLEELIQPIRRALDLYDLGGDQTVAPRPHKQLAKHSERLCALVRAGDLRTAATELPALIIELTTAAHTTDNNHTWSTLATAYRTAYDVATKLGFHDLANVALDRMAWAAEQASDAVSAGLRQYLRALANMRIGEYQIGLQLAEAGRQLVAQGDPGTERDAVTGQLHLGSAILAARAGQADDVTGHINLARQLATTTGEAGHVHWLSFGPTNVSAHHTAALIEQSLYAEALQVAQTITVPTDWPASRAAHHHADIARAYLWTNRLDQAFRSLTRARLVAPQQTRHSPDVRTTMLGIVRAHRRMPDTVTGYAAWLGI